MGFNAFTEMREQRQGAQSAIEEQPANKEAKEERDIERIRRSPEGSVFKNTLKENKEKRNSSQYAKTEPSYEKKEVTKLEDMKTVSELRREEVQNEQPKVEQKLDKHSKDKTKFITFVDQEGNEYKVPNSARAKAKIAKEEKEVEIQRLLNQEAGLVDWNKKYSELDRERTQWKSEAEKTAQLFQDFGKKFAQDPEDGLIFLSEKFNLNPIQVKRLLRDSVGKRAQEYFSLPEEQRRLYDLEEENKYNNQMLQRMSEDRKRHTENEVYEASMREVMQVNKIDDKKRKHIEEWVLGDSGEKLSPEDLVMYSKEYDRINLVYDMVSEIDPKLEDNEELINFLDARVLRNPEMSKNDIKRLAKRYLAAVEEKEEEERDEKIVERLKPKVEEPKRFSEPKSFSGPVRVSDLIGKKR